MLALSEALEDTELLADTLGDTELLGLVLPLGVVVPDMDPLSLPEGEPDTEADELCDPLVLGELDWLPVSLVEAVPVDDTLEDGDTLGLPEELCSEDRLGLLLAEGVCVGRGLVDVVRVVVEEPVPEPECELVRVPVTEEVVVRVVETLPVPELELVGVRDVLVEPVLELETEAVLEDDVLEVSDTEPTAESVVREEGDGVGDVPALFELDTLLVAVREDDSLCVTVVVAEAERVALVDGVSRADREEDGEKNETTAVAERELDADKEGAAL
jgi:hypothetical protein